MKKIIIFILWVLLSSAVWAGRDPLPDKSGYGAGAEQKTLDYAAVIGNDFRAFFSSCSADDFLGTEGQPNVNTPYFFWLDDQKQRARYADPGKSGRPQLRFWGLVPVQMDLRFKGRKLKQIQVCFYRCDLTGERISAEQFLQLHQSLKDKVQEFTGETGKELKANAVDQHGLILRRITVKDKLVFEVVASLVREQSGVVFNEALILKIYPFDPENDPRVEDRRRRGKYQNFADCVRRSPNGDVWISRLPMVDQASTHYCVPATYLRIFRYFGLKSLTLEQVADMFDSKRIGGTYAHKVTEFLTNDLRKYGLRLVEHYDRYSTVQKLRLFRDEYNQLAKQNRKLRLTGDVLALLKEVNPELVRELWRNRTGEYRNFQQMILENVENGIPVPWMAVVHFLPETKGVKRSKIRLGLHQRMIIGYNLRKGTVIYTDTWGEVHKRKSMRLLDAWTITVEYCVIVPADYGEEE